MKVNFSNNIFNLQKSPNNKSKNCSVQPQFGSVPVELITQKGMKIERVNRFMLGRFRTGIKALYNDVEANYRNVPHFWSLARHVAPLNKGLSLVDIGNSGFKEVKGYNLTEIGAAVTMVEEHAVPVITFEMPLSRMTKFSPQSGTGKITKRKVDCIVEGYNVKKPDTIYDSRVITSIKNPLMPDIRILDELTIYPKGIPTSVSMMFHALTGVKTFIEGVHGLEVPLHSNNPQIRAWVEIANALEAFGKFFSDSNLFTKLEKNSNIF